MTSALPPSAPARPYSFGLQSVDVLPVVLTLTAIASGLSGQQPSGNAAADFVLSAAFGGGLVWISRWASTQALLISAVLALFFSGLQLPFAIVGAAAVASAIFVSSWRPLDKESELIGSAITAGLISQVVLNLPSVRWVGTASLLAFVAVVPILWTGWQHLPDKFRKQTMWIAAAVAVFALVSGGLAFYAVSSVRSTVEAGIEQAQDGVAALEAGDQDVAEALLISAQENFELAGGRLEGPLTWPGRFVPVVAQHSRALETAVDEGASLARTAVRTVRSADVERIRGQNGAIDIDLVRQVNKELVNANTVLRNAQLAIRDVRTPWLLPLVSDRLAEVAVELAATNEDIDLANQATAVLPGILGADSPRRYLVLFVQPAESREFGGFVGAFGILEADNGQLSLTESGSINTELGTGEALFTNPEDFPRAYLEIRPEVNPQNLTSVADLPTIARAARDLVPQWRQDENFTIDGVFTLDPYGLAGLLELTGPISIESGTRELTADTVVDFLLRGQYDEFDANDRDLRQDALEELAGAGFKRLLEIELPGPEELGSIFGPIARANRIGFVTFDENENLFLDRVFMRGGMPLVGEFVEMIGIHGATAVTSKLDAFSTRSLTYTVIVDPSTGAVDGLMDITITNDAPPDASGYVLGAFNTEGAQESPNGAPLEIGDNLLAVSVYTRATIENLMSPDGDFSSTGTNAALGYDRTGMLISVPIGTERHITFETSDQLSTGRYDVLFLAQQTANVGEVTLRVQPTTGWRVVSDTTNADGSWTTTAALDVSRGFSVFFERTG